MIANKNQKAFTLVETLLVIGIFSLLLIFTLPAFLDFYGENQLDVCSREVAQALRIVQLKSISVEQDSRFGIYFTENSYILFKGDSYENREVEYDEIFNLPSIIKISGLREIVFEKVSGNPSTAGGIILSNNTASKTVFINSLGRISLE